jgi:hypothetical protein
MSKIYGNLTISTGIFISSIAASAQLLALLNLLFLFLFFYLLT